MHSQFARQDIIVPSFLKVAKANTEIDIIIKSPPPSNYN